MTVTIETYLEDVIDDRLIPMLKEVSAVFTPAVKQVERYVKKTANPPFWWIYPGGVARSKLAPRTRVLTYTVNMRLVLGYVEQTGYNGQLEGSLWTWLPTLITYFEARRSLVYQAGQEPPQSTSGWLLDTENVELLDMTPFGIFEDFMHVGVELPIVLPFKNIRFPLYGGN